MKVKCTNIVMGQYWLTVGKVYDVVRVDDDGDIWIKDDIGDDYFMLPRECEVVDE